MPHTIAEWLVYLTTAVGIGGATAFALFKLLAEKWLTAKFDERLAEYKHAQQKELEQLRFRINAMMDRTVKLHQREFDVVPETWSRLNDALNSVMALVSRVQSYPDSPLLGDKRTRYAHCEFCRS